MKASAARACGACALAWLCLGGCGAADPSLAVVDNAYPVTTETAQQTTVYRVFWAVAEFAEPLAPGQSSEEERVIPASDYAYLLLAPGWDPSSAEPPKRLLPARTKSKVSVARGHRLHIVISEATVDGSCATGSPLSQDDADFITQRIFPGEFSSVLYDASTCSAQPALPLLDSTFRR
ncbi:MAG: hypothetical protein JWN48_3335 [Myxococcaceae bacterium]|nr:hypothetical protein [Myxococcaceae bacterium]